MDRISGLSEELQIKILSYLPTKVAVSTSILSKQWQFLWMLLPKLEYSTNHHYSESDCEKLRCFLHRNLPLHRAPVLESFSLKFVRPHFKPEDIKMWVLAVVSRCIRELKISYTCYPKKLDILPSSLYICKSLVTLKLKGKILVDVPLMVCLPCLKTLRLRNVTYLNEDSLKRLLSNCPVLEDLLVDGCVGDNMGKLHVTVSSLRRLVMYIRTRLDEFVMNTPSLKYLKLENYNSKSDQCLIEKMPKLREACVNVTFPYMERLIGSITSVKRLTLCLIDYSTHGQDLHGDGFVFNKLEHLKLCICEEYASTVLVRLLKDSPKLQILELCGLADDHDINGVRFWNQPSSVPECLLSSLQIFKFSGYQGKPEDRDLATYILQNARHLKTATILSEDCLFETLDMVQELTLSSRASSACQLEFKW